MNLPKWTNWKSLAIYAGVGLALNVVGVNTLGVVAVGVAHEWGSGNYIANAKKGALNTLAFCAVPLLLKLLGV